MGDWQWHSQSSSIQFHPQTSEEAENVIFVPYTQRGVLCKELQTVDDGTTKIMGAGLTLPYTAR